MSLIDIYKEPHIARERERRAAVKMRLLQHGTSDIEPRAVSFIRHRRRKFTPQRLHQERCRCTFRIAVLLILSTLLQSLHGSSHAFNSTKRNITKYPDLSDAPNPYEEGCLYSHGLQYIQRTCNSDDTDTSKCSENEMEYLEIRIHTGDWESIVYESWILQILLSEILHVPTTIDSGLGNAVALNFYNPLGEYSYGRYTLYDSLAAAYNSVDGDCVSVIQSQKDDNPNVTCAHVIPESWRGTFGCLLRCKLYMIFLNAF